MMTRRSLLRGGAAALSVAAGLSLRTFGVGATERLEVSHTEAEWRAKLTADQYAVLRGSGTEQPYTSSLLDKHDRGNFACVGCDLDLFSSTTKFDSGTGWPSFWAPIEDAVGAEDDTSFGMIRTAVHCARCGGHLGHVFEDGPEPTGLRYCINGVALIFRPAAV